MDVLKRATLREYPCSADNPAQPTLLPPILHLFTMATSTHDALIELAMAGLAKQDKPNYLATSKKYGVARITLRDRYTGLSLSKQAAASKYRQCFTFVQEEVLIQHINSLTDRGIPPTSRIVRNLAEEMIKAPVGKNWTGNFVHRYESRLKSVYLRNIDSQRIRAEYVSSFKCFYDLV